MFHWLREFLELKYEFRERKVSEDKLCQSCETLKMQLSIANDEKRDLLNRLLKEPEKEPVREIGDLKPVLPRTHLSWNARRQVLEANDRKTAQILEEKKREINQVEKVSTEDLEKEMNIAEASREAEAKTGTTNAR